MKLTKFWDRRGRFLADWYGRGNPLAYRAEMIWVRADAILERKISFLDPSGALSDLGPDPHAAMRHWRNYSTTDQIAGMEAMLMVCISEVRRS